MSETLSPRRLSRGWCVPLQEKCDRAARGALVFTAFVTPISTAAMNAGLAFLLLFFLLAGRYRERIATASRYLIVWAVMALMALLCLGTLWTIGPLDEAGWQISKYSKLLFVPLVLVLAIDRNTRNAVLWAVLIALVLTAALSFVNALHPLPAWLSRATREGVLEGNNYIFKHHIIQNVFLSFGVLLCAVLAMASPTAMRRNLFVVFAILCASSILFMAQGRTGYLTLIAVIALLMGGWIYHHPKTRWVVAIAAAVMFAAATFSPALQQRVTQTIQDYEAHKTQGASNAVGHRLVFWKTSIQIMRENPWFGAGTGAYRQEFLKRVSDPAFVAFGAYNPHNQFLYFGTQLGLTGVAAYIVLLLTLWKSTDRLPNHRKILAQGVVLILTVYSIFDSPLFITEGHFFVILIGSLWVMGQPDMQANTSNKKPPGLLA
jgi:O-antigen ligase